MPESATMIEAKVPVIDYSVTDSQLSSELYKALTTVGFACLTNTGLWDKVKNLRSIFWNFIFALTIYGHNMIIMLIVAEFFYKFCLEVYYCKLVNISSQEYYATSFMLYMGICSNTDIFKHTPICFSSCISECWILSGSERVLCQADIREGEIPEASRG